MSSNTAMLGLQSTLPLVSFPVGKYCIVILFFFFLYIFIFIFIFYCKQICAEVSKHGHQGVAKK